MKLYDLKRGSYFRILPDEDNLRVPPGAPEVVSDAVYWLGNIDGMYSFCKCVGNGEVVHVFCGAEVEEISISD